VDDQRADDVEPTGWASCSLRRHAGIIEVDAVSPLPQSETHRIVGGIGQSSVQHQLAAACQVTSALPSTLRILASIRSPPPDAHAQYHTSTIVAEIRCSADRHERSSGKRA
jgi:hypothetical protein